MHTATQLSAEQFAVEVDGRPGSLADLLPGWSAADRVGVVVREPFGAVGASALLQASIVAFYDHDPRRRTTRAQYPELHLVHVGGPWGDHSMLELWPARKECVVTDALGALAELNDRGVTRLLVPDGVPWTADVASEVAGAVSGGFSEVAAARSRVVQAWAYDPSGQVRDADVVVRARGAAAAENALAALDPEGLADEFASSPVSDIDDQGWRDRVLARTDEIDQAVRAELSRRLLASLDAGTRTETYRRLPVDDALSLLA